MAFIRHLQQRQEGPLHRDLHGHAGQLPAIFAPGRAARKSCQTGQAPEKNEGHETHRRTRANASVEQVICLTICITWKPEFVLQIQVPG